MKQTPWAGSVELFGTVHARSAGQLFGSDTVQSCEQICSPTVPMHIPDAQPAASTQAAPTSAGGAFTQYPASQTWPELHDVAAVQPPAAPL